MEKNMVKARTAKGKATIMVVQEVDITIEEEVKEPQNEDAKLAKQDENEVILMVTLKEEIEASSD
ncbi:hypothetical protein A2U01_0071863, partial [Trifolium medium]|nr:hypothetical protein [Trifolium medium]